VILERGPLSLESTTEELLGRNSSGFSLEIRQYEHGNSLRRPRDSVYPQKLALTSPTSSCRSIDIVLSWTNAMELVMFSHHLFSPVPEGQGIFTVSVLSRLEKLS
jgi:hypothetical protein